MGFYIKLLVWLTLPRRNAHNINRNVQHGTFVANIRFNANLLCIIFNHINYYIRHQIFCTYTCVNILNTTNSRFMQSTGLY